MNILPLTPRRTLALFSLCALLTQAIALPAFAQTRTVTTTKPSALSGDERILHVINRLSFGARPGDLERVRAMGVERYIAAQLDATKIEDAALEARLKGFPVLQEGTAELLAKYPNPGMLMRRLQREGRLPEDLAALRGLTPNRQNPADAKKQDSPAAMQDDAGAMNELGQSARNDARRDYRRALRDYYVENNLKQPQQIMQQLQASRILRAAYSERQLQEVMVDFWTNHFNVYAGKGISRWLLPAYDRDTIRPNALGNFRDMLRATAESSAMLFYLDNFQSVTPNAPRGMGGRRRALMNDDDGMLRNRGRFGGGQRRNRRQEQNPGAMVSAPQADAPAMPRAAQQQQQRAKRGINENYARELMELHTLGVDGGYTQKDIVEVARAFTGWTIFDPRGYTTGEGGRLAENAGRFYFNPRLHDTGEKIVLGQRIPAGGGVEDGLKVIEILTRHPSTARFVATKLARRFVSDNPNPALVARVAETFTRTDGDIKETLRAVFTSPEFNSPEAYRAKIKTPFELMVSSIRALGAETDARPALLQMLARMGEPLYGYQAPTGYPDTAAAWVSTGALLERLNFALALTANRIPGTRVPLDGQLKLADAKSKERIAGELLDRILHGQVSEGTKRTLMKQIANPAPVSVSPSQQPSSEIMTAEVEPEMNNRQRRGMNRRGANELAINMSADEAELRRIVGLIIGTPEFQRQ